MSVRRKIVSIVTTDTRRIDGQNRSLTLILYRMRRLISYTFVALAVVVGMATAYRASAEPVRLLSRSIPLNEHDLTQTTVGSLEYRGGLWIESTHASFGGFSALGTSASGSRLTALSDHGYRLELNPVYDARGWLTDVAEADLSPLADTDGSVFASKFARDMESLTPGVNGEIIVSFERQHRLLIYSPGDARPVSMPSPDGLAQAPLNGGIEALTLLADGRLLALTESLGGSGERVGWISSVNGWSPLTYAVSDGYEPTGAATLPGGDVLILERFYTPATGAKARIRRIPESAIKPGATLNSLLLAEIRAPMSVDNMEGIAVRPKGGKSVVYLISDDNFNTPEQRTLLLMFEMEEG